MAKAIGTMICAGMPIRYNIQEFGCASKDKWKEARIPHTVIER